MSGSTLALESQAVDEDTLAAHAQQALRLAGCYDFRIAVAESCTGGLLSSLLTNQPGLSKWFDRGFVVYTEESKGELLGVSRALIREHGVVRAPVAHALAVGALARSGAGIAVGITGFAGEAGPDDEAGLVYIAAVDRRGRCAGRECHFGDVGRDQTRRLACVMALKTVSGLLQGRFALPESDASDRLGYRPLQQDTMAISEQGAVPGIASLGPTSWIAY